MRGKPYLVRSLALSGISPNLDGKTLVSGSRPQSGRWAVLVGMRQTHHIKDNAFRMCKAPLLHGSGQNFKEYVLTYPAPPAHPRILQSRRTGSALLVYFSYCGLATMVDTKWQSARIKKILLRPSSMCGGIFKTRRHLRAV